MLKSKLSKAEVIWQTIIFIVVTITALEAPYSFTFKTRIQNWQLLLDLFISLIFISDVFYQLRQKSKGLVKFENTSDRNTWWFMLAIDVLASIPFDIISYSLGGADGVKIFTLIRLFRLVRIIRLVSIINQLTVIPQSLRLSIYSVSFVIIVHWISCCWILIHGPEYTMAKSQYIKAMYWTVTTLTTIGYGDITPTSDGGRIFTMIIMILGVGVYGVVIGNVSRLIVAGERYKEEARQKMNDIASFMRYYNVPERLQQNIYSYYNHILTKRLTDNDNKIISELPHALQQEMQVYMNIKLIRSLPIFKECSQSCLKDVAASLTQKYYGPGQTIINIGEIGSEMYIIGHGLVEVILKDGNTVATLHEGQFFGEAALLRETKRNANVRAQTYCDLYMLNKDDFVKITEKHPELSETINSVNNRRATDRK